MTPGDPPRSGSDDRPDVEQSGRDKSGRTGGDRNRIRAGKKSTIIYQVGNRESSRGEWSTLTKLAAVAGIVAALAAVVTLILNLIPKDPDSDAVGRGQLVQGRQQSAPCAGGASSAPPSTATGQPSSDPFQAIIDGTMDVDSGSFVGVISYRDPTERGKGTDVGHYRECQTVSVVCRIPDGRTISDKPWQDRPLSTTGWYRLTNPTPTWLPDMYVTIMDARGASSVPRCE